MSTWTEDRLRAGDHPVVEVPVVIESGAGSLVRGTVLGRVTASGKYKAYNASATDGTEVPRGILAQDVDASSADVNASMYVHGEFNEDELTGLDDAGKLKLMEFGIYVKKRR